MRHIISMLLENESGALSRVAGLFSARGYNIESLTVAPTEDGTLSRLTLVTSGSDEVIEQITKQLNKLVDVVKLVDLTEGQHIEREMLLIKVKAVNGMRDEVKRLVDIFRGRIIDVTEGAYTIELTGTGDKLDALCRALAAAKKRCTSELSSLKHLTAKTPGNANQPIRFPGVLAVEPFSHF
jgi:acetolactate synthase I/III small subunit